MKFFIFSFFSLLFFSCQDKGFTLKSSEFTHIDFNNIIIENDTLNILNQEYIFNGGGVLSADFDNDGLRDLFFTGNQVPNKLYKNLGGLKFKDITSQAMVAMEDQWSTGSTYADVNGDGHLDLFVCTAMYKNKRSNKLFVNLGPQPDGTIQFEDQTIAYGLDSTNNSMGAVFFDYNKDGFQDLFVLNNEQNESIPMRYRKKVVDGSALSNDQLFRNNGDGTFTDVSLQAGILVEGFGLGVAITDINMDLWPDIVIANDYLTNDIIYINNHDGTFSEKASKYLKHQSMFSMGVDASDVNNDGYSDLFFLDMLGDSNYRQKTTVSMSSYQKAVLDEKWDYQSQHSRNMLHAGGGAALPFEEVGMYADVFKTDWSWSSLFFDADNDGQRDLFITNGFPRDITDKDFSDYREQYGNYVAPNKLLDLIPIVKQHNYVYNNHGNFHFKEVTKEWGLELNSFSNGAIFSDLDNDGDLDYVVNNINDEAFVFENRFSNDNNFINFELVGPRFNPTGIGVKLVLHAGEGKYQVHQNFHTRGYMSSVDDRIHFGLGTLKKIDSVEVLWPDNMHQTIRSVSLNKTIKIAHKQAVKKDINTLVFPMVAAKIEAPDFTEVSDQRNIRYTHQQKDLGDFFTQRLLSRKITENGPKIISLDTNLDGLKDFVVSGSSDSVPLLFEQQPNETFLETTLIDTQLLIGGNVEDIISLDINTDGFEDIVLAVSYNDFNKNQYYSTLITLINDGTGSFTPDLNKFQALDSQIKTLIALDVNLDGYKDIFAIGNTILHKYPFSDPNLFFLNNKGVFSNETSKYLSQLDIDSDLASAEVIDFNGDGWSDLVLGFPFESLKWLKNDKGNGFVLVNNKETSSLKGWWQRIKKMDYDLDGDDDLLIGNIGENNQFNIEIETPLSLLVKDYDNNGFYESILFSFNKGQDGKLKSYPIPFWGNLSGQSPFFKKLFKSYKEFAAADISQFIFDEDYILKEINTDESILLENLGENDWVVKKLPNKSQYAPIYDFDSYISKEGENHILVVGNDFGNDSFYGPLDGINGLHYKVNERQLIEIPKLKSMFNVTGNARDIQKLSLKNGKTLFIVSQNNGKLLALELNE